MLCRGQAVFIASRLHLVHLGIARQVRALKKTWPQHVCVEGGDRAKARIVHPVVASVLGHATSRSRGSNGGAPRHGSRQVNSG